MVGTWKGDGAMAVSYVTWTLIFFSSIYVRQICDMSMGVKFLSITRTQFTHLNPLNFMISKEKKLTPASKATYLAFHIDEREKFYIFSYSHLISSKFLDN